MFSLYDIEQILRDAGAERIQEKAVISLEKELQDIAKELVEAASVYANYAGRKKVINVSDIDLARKGKTMRYIKYKGRVIRKRKGGSPRAKAGAPKLMLINNMPVVKAAQDISAQNQG